MIQHIISIVFLSAGFFITTVAVIGVLRFPDFYTRLHASGKVEGFGITLVLIGLAVHSGLTFTSLKVVIIAILIMFANPIGTHLLGKAAYQSGLKPWTGEEDK